MSDGFFQRSQEFDDVWYGHNSSDGLLHVGKQSMQLVVPFLQ